jgi:hypothetical protein
VLVKTLRREKTGLSPIGTICNDSFEDRIPDVGFIVLVVQMGNILEFDQVFPEGDLGQVGNGSYIQLFHNIILVGFHGLRADTESLLDISGVQPVRQKREHLLLADAETNQTVFDLPGGLPISHFKILHVVL